ncbi:MAG: hypothetical protein WC916_06255 [Candidatus Woesearchaeota archaeon]
MKSSCYLQASVLAKSCFIVMALRSRGSIPSRRARYVYRRVAVKMLA